MTDIRQTIETIEPIPLTHADEINVKAINSMLAIARLRLPHKREPWYRAAGQHLAHLRRGKHTEIFAEIVRKHCGLGLARAYELMALGAGKRLATLRAEKAGKSSGKGHRGTERQKTPVPSMG